MNGMLRIAALALLVSATPAFAGKPPPPPPPPAFGAPSTQAKIGESSGMYSGGFHSVVRDGSTLHALYVSGSEPMRTDAPYEIVYTLRLAQSVDGGLTWGEGKILVRSPDLSRIGPALAVGLDPVTGGRRLHVIWSQYNPVTMTSDLRYSYGSALWDWRSWTPPRTIATCEDYTAVIAADEMGGVHVACTAGEAGVWSVLHAESADGGETFTAAAPLFGVTEDRYASMAAVGGNVFYATRSGVRAVYAQKLAGEGWSPLVDLGPGPGSGSVSLVALDPARVYVAWTGPDCTADGVLVAAKTGAAATAWRVQPAQGLTARCTDLSLAASATGVLGLAWDGGGSTNIHFSRSADGGSTWTAPVAASWGYTPNLAFNAAGKAVIAFKDANVWASTREK